MNKKIGITTLLFLIGTLHTMVFSFVQFPNTFVAADIEYDPIFYKAVLYFFTVGISCFHQPIARKLGLKNVLILGLLGNIVGLLLLFAHHFLEHPTHNYLLFFSMVFMGASMLSVVNSLVTYIIIEFTSKSVSAITALFIFLNGGVMLTPVTLNKAASLGINWGIFFIMIFLLLLSIFAIQKFFFEPSYPKHLEHLRSGTLIWKEMHRRLALYILVILIYSIIESTFSLWGAVLLSEYVPLNIAQNAASIFWLFMILGQLLFMIPLYYLQPRKVFYFLMPLIIAALLYTSKQNHLFTISLGLSIGGISCAVVYPIVLSLLEMEIIQVSLMSNHPHYLPLLDTAVSFLMANYLLGSSVIDLWISAFPKALAPPYFHFAVLYVLVITMLMYYLNKTRTISSGIKRIAG